MLTNTGFQLSDIGGSLDWNAMRIFMRNLPADSAVEWEIHPEFAAWSSHTKTNFILADIFDILANINANLVAIGSGEKAKTPKPYPRPIKKQPENERHFGRGALPPDKLREWFEQKRREKCR